MEPIKPDVKVLTDIVTTKMPFGKYKGTLISDLPVYYLEWLKNKGLPAGKLGMMLSTTYEIKVNGLTRILDLIKAAMRNNVSTPSSTIPKIKF